MGSHGMDGIRGFGLIMARTATTFIEALNAIAYAAKVQAFEVNAIEVSQTAMTFDALQSFDITEWALADDDHNGEMYEVSAGDASIGYVYITDTVYYERAYV
jgi:hypothetical protein